MAAAAFLLKQSAVPLLLVLAFAVATHPAPIRERLGAAVWGTAGAAIVFALVFLPYVVAGAPTALLEGLGFKGGWWVQYADVGAAPSGGKLAALMDGFTCIGRNYFVGIGLVALASIPVGWQLREDRPGLRENTAAILFAVASFVGVAVTLRFFLHHMNQLWPAIVVLAVRPGGLGGWLFLRLAPNRLFASIAMLALGIATSFPFIQKGWNLDWQRRDDVVAQICKTVGPFIGTDEPVLAVGWQAWGVYEHCRRLAPGPVYKDLTFLTTTNTNTCTSTGLPLALRPGPIADRYIRDFDASPPALVVWYAHPWPGADPGSDWRALRERLDRYRALAQEDRFVMFLRPDVFDAVSRQVAETGEPIDTD